MRHFLIILCVLATSSAFARTVAKTISSSFAVSSSTAPAASPSPTPVTGLPTAPAAPIYVSTPAETPVEDCMKKILENEYAAFNIAVAALQKLWRDYGALAAQTPQSAQALAAKLAQIEAKQGEVDRLLAAYNAKVVECKLSKISPEDQTVDNVCINKFTPPFSGIGYWTRETDKYKCEGFFVNGYLKPYPSVAEPDPRPAGYAGKPVWYGYCLHAIQMAQNNCQTLLETAKDDCYKHLKDPMKTNITNLVTKCEGLLAFNLTPPPVRPAIVPPMPAVPIRRAPVGGGGDVYNDRRTQPYFGPTRDTGR